MLQRRRGMKETRYATGFGPWLGKHDLTFSDALLIDDRTANCDAFRAHGGISENWDLHCHTVTDLRRSLVRWVRQRQRSPVTRRRVRIGQASGFIAHVAKARPRGITTISTPSPAARVSGCCARPARANPIVPERRCSSRYVSGPWVPGRRRRYRPQRRVRTGRGWAWWRVRMVGLLSGRVRNRCLGARYGESRESACAGEGMAAGRVAP